MKRLFILAWAGWMMIGAVACADKIGERPLMESKSVVDEVIVQIFGRMCEYHREDVEAALRGFSIVRQVEFLNNHGTVLVRYQPGRETPEQLAGSVHRALASGWNCSARVDRGEQRLVTVQPEGKP